jgi:transposase
MPKTIKHEPHLDSKTPCASKNLQSTTFGYSSRPDPRPAELENRYRKAHDPVLRSHYQIVWLISEGKTTRQVMEVTGYSRGWIQQLARRYNRYGPEALGDRRHRNPGAKERALLTAEQQEELKVALFKPPPEGGMWNSPKVGEWIERRTGKVVSQKKQRGWD